MKITIKDGNLPENVSIFITTRGEKMLMIEGQTYGIPADEEMAAAVLKRQMEGEAINLANWERRLARLDIYSREYESQHASWMVARDAFQTRWGKDDTTVYNEAVIRA